MGCTLAGAARTGNDNDAIQPRTSASQATGPCHGEEQAGVKENGARGTAARGGGSGGPHPLAASGVVAPGAAASSRSQLLHVHIGGADLPPQPRQDLSLGCFPRASRWPARDGSSSPHWLPLRRPPCPPLASRPSVHGGAQNSSVHLSNAVFALSHIFTASSNLTPVASMHAAYAADCAEHKMSTARDLQVRAARR